VTADEDRGGASLARLVMSRRILVAVGAGGVGKTTVAAALGIAAARRGRRVLCLTIDPARRLAQALGLETMSSAEQVVSPSRYAPTAGAQVGSLTAMMLDSKSTFDQLVRTYAPSPEHARRLLDNKLYRYVSTSLAGTKEYMAIEKLIELREDDRFDLIVLDTPPTANALDFLDAPERLVEALDSSTIRLFLQAWESTGKFSLNLLTRSASLIMRGLGRITGGDFLESMARFLLELNDLFGGFKERAKAVRAALRSSDVSFVLVTSPAPMSIREVRYFEDRLSEAGMPRGAFVVNRVRRVPEFSETPPASASVRASAAAHGLSADDDLAGRLATAHSDAAALAALDRRHLGEIADRGVPIVEVGELARDIRDLSALGQMAELLMAG
jgi:anion-transporting  ArsA/GET3 family ATPase